MSGPAEQTLDGGPPAMTAETEKDSLRLIEAILFAAKEPVSERMLKARLPEGADLKALLKALQADYAERGVNLSRAGGSWAFRTATDLAPRLQREIEVTRKLSRAAVETLAIIAYHQPVTRAEIEEIRGVSLSRGTLDVLLEEKWIKPRGRRETPGRPLQWGTTDGFLDHFGLENIRDLPGLKELKAMGLLEAGPALNVYRSQGELDDGEDGDPAPAGGGSIDVAEETEPLDPLGDDALGDDALGDDSPGDGSVEDDTSAGRGGDDDRPPGL